MDGRFDEPTKGVIDGENIGASRKKRLTELLHLCFTLLAGELGFEVITLRNGKSGHRQTVFSAHDRLDYVLGHSELCRI